MTQEALSSATSGPQGAVKKFDGRNRRAAETRRKIIEAARQMVAYEQVPTARAVAVLAGVSVRSVFQHFGDVDSLSRELRTVIIGEVTQRVAAIPTPAPSSFEDRVEFAVGQLCGVYFGRDAREVDQIRSSVAWAFDGPRREMEDSEARRKFGLALEKLLFLGLFKEEYDSLQASGEDRHERRQERVRAMVTHLLWPRSFLDFLCGPASTGMWTDLQYLVSGAFLYFFAQKIHTEILAG